jgi:hypothetical protein
MHMAAVAAAWAAWAVWTCNTPHQGIRFERERIFGSAFFCALPAHPGDHGSRGARICLNSSAFTSIFRASAQLLKQCREFRLLR